jgi:hypothetical protein
MQNDTRFSIGQAVGTVLIVMTSLVPGAALAGFHGGTAWSLLVWLPVSMLGGGLGGLLMARSHRIAGAVGGMFAGPMSLMAVYLYARNRDRMFRSEVVIIGMVASLPGLGIFFILRLLTDLIFPPRPREEDEPIYRRDEDRPRRRRRDRDDDDDDEFDDGPRTRRRSYDDGDEIDDMSPRRRRRDDDEDEPDDRPRRRRRHDDEFDDDDADRRRRR